MRAEVADVAGQPAAKPVLGAETLAGRGIPRLCVRPFSPRRSNRREVEVLSFTASLVSLKARR